MRTIGLTGRVRAILYDEKWHSVSDIVESVGDYITPETAIRGWLNKWRRKSGVYSKSDIYAIHQGKRLAVVKVLYHLRVVRKEIEVKYEGKKVKSARMLA